MIIINLTAEKQEEILVKEYLQENATGLLADKINNGVPIEKDGLKLINKKDLKGFMQYACEEARKQSEKGVISTCIDNQVVFGWAIHYFEEDTIEGALYNEDGTEYKPKPVMKERTATAYTLPPPKPKPQMSMFDNQCEISTTDGQEAGADDNEESGPDEFETNAEELHDDKSEEPVIQISETRVVDKDGVVHGITKQTQERETANVLFRIFGDKLIEG